MFDTVSDTWIDGVDVGCLVNTSVIDRITNPTQVCPTIDFEVEQRLASLEQDLTILRAQMRYIPTPPFALIMTGATVVSAACGILLGVAL